MADEQEKTDFKEKALEFIAAKKKLIAGLAIAAAIAYGIFGGKGDQPKAPTQTTKEQGAGSVTTEERLKAELESLKKSIEEMKAQKKQPDEKPAEKPKEQLPKEPAEKPQSLKDLEAIIKGKPKEEKQPQAPTGMPPMQFPPAAKPEPQRLVKIDIPETKIEPPKPMEQPLADIYLPAGSFASFTLYSGAYAPETGEQMPVSAVIDKVFVGPNKSSVPLKGCVFLGKAKGNTGYKTADIKAVKLSCVWPDGKTFEADISGYVTDNTGEFGLKGRVIRHTGTYFSTVGITSFIEGFTAGIAKAYESETATAAGEAVQKVVNIAGDAATYGAMKGLTGFASAAKQFYSQQMQGLIPAVEVQAGSKGYVYITSGVTIKGGKQAIYGNKNYYDMHNLSSAQ